MSDINNRHLLAEFDPLMCQSSTEPQASSNSNNDDIFDLYTLQRINDGQIQNSHSEQRLSQTSLASSGSPHISTHSLFFAPYGTGTTIAATSDVNGTSSASANSSDSLSVPAARTARMRPSSPVISYGSDNIIKLNPPPFLYPRLPQSQKSLEELVSANLDVSLHISTRNTARQNDWAAPESRYAFICQSQENFFPERQSNCLSQCHYVTSTTDKELYEFAMMVNRVKRTFEKKIEEEVRPPCLYNPTFLQHHVFYQKVEVIVYYRDHYAEIPWNVDSKTEEILMGALFGSSLSEEIHKTCEVVDCKAFLLRIKGTDEYLKPDSVLIHHKLFQETVRVKRLEFNLERLADLRSVQKIGIRKDHWDGHFNLPDHYGNFRITVNGSDLEGIVSEFVTSKSKLLELTSYDQATVTLSNLVQYVKLICSTCGILILPETHRYLNDLETLFNPPSPDMLAQCLSGKLDLLQETLLMQINLFSVSWCANFHFTNQCLSGAGLATSWKTEPHNKEVSVGEFHDYFKVTIASCHRIPPEDKFSNNKIEYKVKCELYHGEQFLDGVCTEAGSYIPFSGNNGLDYIEWKFSGALEFATTQVSRLPRESILCFTLFGTKNTKPPLSSDYDTSFFKNNEPIAWVNLRLFDVNNYLKDGPLLLPMWDDRDTAKPTNTCETNLCYSDPCKAKFVLYIRLPTYKNKISNLPISIHFNDKFVNLATNFVTPHLDEHIDDGDIEKFASIINRPFTECRLQDSDKVFIFNKRWIFLANYPSSLPLILQSFGGYQCMMLNEIYDCLKAYKQKWLNPDAVKKDFPMGTLLQLLTISSPDIEVRKFAISEIMNYLQGDNVELYLPQVLQCLMSQPYLTSTPLLENLLVMCLENFRFANSFYWQLMLYSSLDSRYHRKRLTLIVEALKYLCGKDMVNCWLQQEHFVDLLHPLALKVQEHKSTNIFRKELKAILGDVVTNLTPLRLPHQLHSLVCDLQIDNSLFFSSKTCPLKLTFDNFYSEDRSGISVIYKAGDDLNMDALCLQMTSIFNHLWRLENLDLKILLFNVFPMSRNAGFVELVADCMSLKNVHLAYGSSFDERAIDEFIRRYNSTEAEYNQAVDNFVRSLAGWLVITYVLGVCDRHNDNIMICHSGHLFHIDFAKLMGDSEKFLGFSRDRVPVVFTKDMFYAINGGPNVTPKYFEFLKLCCEAFSSLRRHSSFLLTMIELMLPAGIPRFDREGIAYIQTILEPTLNDLFATRKLNQLLDKCLHDDSAMINNKIHTFFNPEEKNKHMAVHSIGQDGRIAEILVSFAGSISYGDTRVRDNQTSNVFNFQVTRVNKSTGWVQKRRDEIFTFHKTLCSTFPSVKIGEPVFSSSQEATVLQNLNTYCKAILSSVPDVSESKYVYTFFHPNMDSPTLGRNNRFSLTPSSHGYSELPSLQVGFLYEAKACQLCIALEYVSNLSSNQQAGGELYLKLYLLPDRQTDKQSKKKVTLRQEPSTSGRRHCFISDDPLVYNNLPSSSLSTKELSIALWVNPSLSPAREIGSITLNLSQFIDETIHYMELHFKT